MDKKIHRCPHCHKETKFEPIGFMLDRGLPENKILKIFLRCPHCKGNTSLDLTEELRKLGELYQIWRISKQ